MNTFSQALTAPVPVVVKTAEATSACSAVELWAASPRIISS
ncbi:MAG: hypothetical protein QW168_01415 [Sulfolobales archaeon]